jgi:hypothetical protein
MMTLKNSLRNESLDALEKRKLHLDHALTAATEHGVDYPPDLKEEFDAIQNELTRREKNQ